MRALVPQVRSRGFHPRRARERCIAAVLLIGCLSVAAMTYDAFRSTGYPKQRVTKSLLRSYVAAYAGWADANPERTCPDQLVDLVPWIDQRDTKDAWGGDLQWSCATHAGRRQLSVWSLGEDQILGTPDDMWSYQ